MSARRIVVVAAVVMSAAVARADRDRLVLDAGDWRLRGTLELGLDTGMAARPFSIAPDAWYGVAPRLTVGIVHSNAAVGLIDAGGSACFRGPSGTCAHVYRGSGLDALWSWLAGDLAIASRVRLLLRDIDPVKPAVTLGGLVRWTRGDLAITGDPYLRLGLAHQGDGNRAAVVVPLWLAWQPVERWRVALHTGWDTELATWRDGWHVPFGLDLDHQLGPELDVGLEAGFPHLLGPQNNIKLRSASIYVAYRPR
ncbi:MAG TPA: hypothetical protein VGC42_00825 [Kofleriaceae bacterium]